MAVEAANAYADLGLALKAPATKNAELGQAEFLQLMTTQLQNQDPFKPMESGEFLSQIAQFSTVSGIQQLNAAFAGLSSSLSSGQALQAAGLVGRDVLVASDNGFLPAGGGGLRGAVDVPAGGRLLVDVVSDDGQLLATVDAGMRDAGLQHFEWNGVAADGSHPGSGTYELRARLQQNDNATALPTFAVGRILSVTLGGSDLALELEGLEPATLASVRQYL